MLGGRRVMEAIDLYEMNRTPRGTNLNWIPRAKYLEPPKRRTHKHEYNSDITDYQKASLRLNICEIPSEAPYEKFNRLLNQWQEESIVMSSITEMVMLPSYQAIIGMGPAVVRLILNELKHDPDYFFWALEAITGDNPVMPEDEGNLDRMTNAWIKWGQENGII